MKTKLLLLVSLLTTSFIATSCGKKNYKEGDPLVITSIEMADEYGESTLIQHNGFDILVDSCSELDANHVKEVLNANDINCETTIEESQGENDSDSGENREESRQGAGQEQPKHNHTVFASDDGTEVREEDNEDNYSVNEEEGSISYFA